MKFVKYALLIYFILCVVIAIVVSNFVVNTLEKECNFRIAKCLGKWTKELKRDFEEGQK